MLFNSLSFAVFLPLVFVFYWFVFPKSIKGQNCLLLLSSYFFYGCWDWRFMFLLIFSTFLDFYTGIKIADGNPQASKRWLWASVGINLGFLGLFKYYNFFAEQFQLLLQSVGLNVSIWSLSLILPVGISFYTFHGLSYVVDLYYKRIEPERDWVNYSVFVSFFPLLVAGPIERATHLLPQIKQPKVFDYQLATDGLRQILWGLFKKVVIADNCAQYADEMFNHSADQSGSNLLMGAFFFSMQIYGDFSGYSDIALGVAKLFGVKLLKNFSFPYFSRDIAEFWRRWHISLSGWFRDYLYIPLGGSKGGLLVKIRNTFIIFLVSGFWHGANWTFILWGLLHACYFLPLLLSDSNRQNLQIVAAGRWLPSLRELLQMLLTFLLVLIAWVFFRAHSVTAACDYLLGMCSLSLWTMPTVFPLSLLGFIGLMLGVEWLGREGNFGVERLPLRCPRWLRWIFYLFITMLIFLFQGDSQQFIYFQF